MTEIKKTKNCKYEYAEYPDGALIVRKADNSKFTENDNEELKRIFGNRLIRTTVWGTGDFASDVHTFLNKF